MTLTITVDFEAGNGLEMENNLNKAIKEIEVVLTKKGLWVNSEFELIGIDGDLKQLYKVIIK